MIPLSSTVEPLYVHSILRDWANSGSTVVTEQVIVKVSFKTGVRLVVAVITGFIVGNTERKPHKN